MAQDFGLLKSSETIQTADYRSAGSHQSENLNFEFITDTSVYEEILVVPEGKTYYLTSVIISGTIAGGEYSLATGAIAAETQFLVVRTATAGIKLAHNFTTPVKFSSGSRITGYQTVNDDAYYTLVGWEE